MFRDDRELAAVCQALCDRTTGLGACWTIAPPGITARNRQLLRRNPHSHGERLLYDLAWVLWNGCRTPDLRELVHVLDRGHLAAVGELLTAIAFGPDGIEAWLDENAPDCRTGSTKKRRAGRGRDAEALARSGVAGRGRVRRAGAREGPWHVTRRTIR